MSTPHGVLGFQSHALLTHGLVLMLHHASRFYLEQGHGIYMLLMSPAKIHLNRQLKSCLMSRNLIALSRTGATTFVSDSYSTRVLLGTAMTDTLGAQSMPRLLLPPCSPTYLGVETGISKAIVCCP